MENKHQIVLLGATGAVGSEVVKNLILQPMTSRLSLLSRRAVAFTDHRIENHVVDVFSPSSYAELLSGFDVAICTMGVGQPSKVTPEEFIRVDKTAVLDFASACKAAGVAHFVLLSSVSSDVSSASLYLRTKAELEAGLKALNFKRLSVFKPSMILTPKNRYGISQAITLKVWPLISPLFWGGMRKFRGIKVEDLGKAIALNVFKERQGVEALHWDEFQQFLK